MWYVSVGRAELDRYDLIKCWTNTLYSIRHLSVLGNGLYRLLSIRAPITNLLSAGKLAPRYHQQVCVQRGTHDGPIRSGGPEDPGLVLYADPEAQPGGGGLGGGEWYRDRRSRKHGGALFLPSRVHWTFLWGEISRRVTLLALNKNLFDTRSKCLKRGWKFLLLLLIQTWPTRLWRQKPIGFHGHWTSFHF